MPGPEAHALARSTNKKKQRCAPLGLRVNRKEHSAHTVSQHLSDYQTAEQSLQTDKIWPLTTSDECHDTGAGQLSEDPDRSTETTEHRAPILVASEKKIMLLCCAGGGLKAKNLAKENF